MEFDALIAPLSRAQFLRDYWDKSYLRSPGTTGRFAQFLTWDELDAILEQHRLTPPRIKLYQNGQALDPQRYLTDARFGVPRLDSGGLAACLAQGATLILDDVQELAPRVQSLMHVFQDAFHTDAFANLYVSWHTDNAFDLHWDPQASIILQVAGRKRWKIYKPTRVTPLQNDIEPSPRPTGEPVWDGVMENGDTLYIPRGWWHVAFPLNEPSLHLTVSLTPPSGIDFLGWAIARLRKHAVLRADLPAMAGPDALKEYIEELRAQVNEAITPSAAGDFLREWEANIRPTPHIRLQNSSRAPASIEASHVRLASLHRLFLTVNGANFEFQAAGRIWTVPPELLPAFEMLSNSRSIPLAELTAKISGPVAAENLRKSLGVLSRAGVILLENDT